MRKGYWNTLLSRLRGRVAQGHNALHLENITFVLHDICAAEGVPLEQDAAIILAVDSAGNALLVHPASTAVSIRIDRTGEVSASGLTLLDMIDKLQPGLASGSELMALPEDQHILDRITRGRSSRARGLFDDD
jgi:hypothetical protein